jgi:hypothetical protein
MTIAASVAIATIQAGAAQAAEECLAAPSTGAPTGQHWFYRIEPDTKRHCWYLGDKAKLSSRAPASVATQPATPDTSTDNAAARPAADARAEWQRPRTLAPNDKDPRARNLNARDLAVRSERPAPVVAPVSSEPGAPVSAFTASPDPSPQVIWPSQPNALAAPAGTPQAPLAMGEASAPGTNAPWTNPPDTNAAETDAAERNAAETSKGASPEAAPTSAAVASAESEVSATGSTPSVVGLTLILLGALILLGLAGGAIYRRVAARARWRRYRSFGYKQAARERYAAPSSSDVDDNLRRMRDLLARLGHEAQSQGEEAGAELYSGQL